MRKYLDEHDRDVYETELAEDAALAKREFARWLGRRWPGDYLPDDSYNADDPYDRLKSEGGHLSE